MPHVLERAKLRAPVDDQSRIALATAAGLTRLPVELDELLSWHDGQDGIGSILEESTDFGGHRFLSASASRKRIDEARHWELPGWKPSYIPIFEGGGRNGCVDAVSGLVEFWEHEGNTFVVGMLSELLSMNHDAWLTWSERSS
jgi:cell wall assembly regulator SMI1